MLICNREGGFGRSTIVCHTNLCHRPWDIYFLTQQLLLLPLPSMCQRCARPWSGRVVTICTEVGNGECYEVNIRNRKQGHWWKTKHESRPTVKRKVSCSLLPPYFCFQWEHYQKSLKILAGHHIQYVVFYTRRMYLNICCLVSKSCPTLLQPHGL